MGGCGFGLNCKRDICVCCWVVEVCWFWSKYWVSKCCVEEDCLELDVVFFLFFWLWFVGCIKNGM